MTELASLVACILLAGLAIFQIALILGVPIGRFAWGGQHDTLPTRLRIGSAVSIMLYLLFAIFILGKAGLVSTPLSDGVLNIGMWVLTGYFILGIIMNGISRSKSEKRLMTPIAAALAALSLIVAIS
jgi:hypothetical protein